ncbi:MAG: lysophospholipase [Eubacterium sp.]|nr:lysophospholipase [Candidatus Colimonas fimequi]
MFDNFVLRELDKGKIAGYTWPLENPDKVVCIIHGIGEYGGRFDRVAEEFRKKNVAVLSMDLRGHGISMNKKGHCAPRVSVLEDITELIKYAQKKYPGIPVILYGHSMGGNIVLDYRCRGGLNGQLAGYIITAPWIRLVRPLPAPLVGAVTLMKKVKPDLTIGSAVDESKLGHPDKVKPYSTNPMVHNMISMETAYDGYKIGLALENGTHTDNGRAHDIPTLLMHGSEDAICDVEGSRIIAEHALETQQNVQYIEWPGLYHEIHNGGPDSTGDEVIETIVNWVTE